MLLERLLMVGLGFACMNGFSQPATQTEQTQEPTPASRAAETYFPITDVAWWFYGHSERWVLISGYIIKTSTLKIG